MASSELNDSKSRATLVLAILSGSTSLHEASERHRLSVDTLQEWRKTFVEAGSKAVGAVPVSSKESEVVRKAARAARRVELDDFERYSLIPGIRGHLSGIQECFERVLKRAQDPETAKAMAFPLSKLATTPFRTATMPGKNHDEIATNYMKTIAEQCESDFMEPADELMSSADLVSDLPALLLWASRVRSFCSTVIRNKDILFVFLLPIAISAQDTNSGEVIVAPPIERSVVVLPFDAHVREAARIAEACDQSLEKWSQSLLSARDRLMAFWSSHENLRSSRLLVRSQFLTLALSFVAVVLGFAGGDLWNLAKQNRSLTTQVASLAAERDACRATAVAMPQVPGPTRPGAAVPQKSLQPKQSR